MAVYWILTLVLCTTVCITTGTNGDSCEAGSYECNPSNNSTYRQCDHGSWYNKTCSNGTLCCINTGLCYHPVPDSCFTDGQQTPSKPPSFTQCPIINIEDQCPCLTPHPKYLNLTREDLEELLAEVKAELTLKKASLTMYIRRKVSARDDRVTSKIMGYTGAMMLAVPFLVIVLSDVIDLFRFLSHNKRREVVTIV